MVIGFKRAILKRCCLANAVGIVLNTSLVEYHLIVDYSWLMTQKKACPKARLFPHGLVSGTWCNYFGAIVWRCVVVDMMPCMFVWADAVTNFRVVPYVHSVTFSPHIPTTFRSFCLQPEGHVFELQKCVVSLGPCRTSI